MRQRGATGQAGFGSCCRTTCTEQCACRTTPAAVERAHQLFNGTWQVAELTDNGETPDTQDALLEYPGFTAV